MPSQRPPRRTHPPLPRVDGYVPLRSYGAIGDGRTIALIADDGSIDWYSAPNLLTPPIFAAIIDAPHGGRVDLCPTDEFTVRRRYVPGTNVLETTFTTDSGVVRMTDALVTGIAGRLPWSELARRVDGVSGSVRMQWTVAPGTALNSASPWVESTANGPVIRIDGVMMAVVGLNHGPKPPESQSMSGEFETSEGSRHLVAISATEDEPLRVLTPPLVDKGIDRTISNWKFWSEEFDYEGEWADEVQRGALALKLLVHSPNGSIAAAGTTSLPESGDGSKNWDYRFAWIRDLAYTVHALIRFGLREETHAAISWLLRTIRAHGPELSVFYTLDGQLPGGEETHEVDGWRGRGPVVVGNDARNQLQLGVYGDLFDIVRLYVDDGNVLDADTGRLLAALADRACDQWQIRDAGIWELEDRQHYTTSKIGCWQALRDAVHLADAGQIPGGSERWAAERDRIYDWVQENCWSETRQSYVIYPGSDDLDASILLHAPSGFERGERMSRTIDALQAELGRGPLMYRYSGMQDEEGTFVACAFWAAGALACVGRMDEAKERMNQLLALGNDVGVWAEMVDAENHEFLGNLPQALSHLALVNAALTIEELQNGSRIKSSRST